MSSTFNEYILKMSKIYFLRHFYLFKLVNDAIIIIGDNLKNIYLFIGDEPLIIKNKIDILVENLNCDQYNTTIYNLEEVNISMAIQDAMTPPFLCKNKIIILRNPIFLTTQKTDIKHNIAMFSDYLSNPLDTTYLIVDATGLNLNEKSDLVVKLKAKAEVSETKELCQVQIDGWLKRQCEVNGIEIKPDAISLFFERVGKNIIIAKNEVDKLVNYVYPKKIITVRDVNEVVTKEAELEAFALTNAIIDKNKEKTINIYNELIKNGKDVMQLISMVSRSMMDMLVVSRMIAKGYQQLDIAQAMNVSSGRAYYLIKNTKAFKMQSIEDNIIKLANLDYKVKSGQIDPTSGLELFIFGL